MTAATVPAPADTDRATDLDIAALRATTFTTIGALTQRDQHSAGLTPPSVVDGFPFNHAGCRYLSLNLTFDRGDRAAVEAWAVHLGLPEPEERTSSDGSRSWYRTSRSDYVRPLWIGWHSITLTAHDEPSTVAAEVPRTAECTCGAYIAFDPDSGRWVDDAGIETCATEAREWHSPAMVGAR